MSSLVIFDRELRSRGPRNGLVVVVGELFGICLVFRNGFLVGFLWVFYGFHVDLLCFTCFLLVFSCVLLVFYLCLALVLAVSTEKDFQSCLKPMYCCE